MTEKDSALRRSRRAKAPALLFSGRLAAEACALCRNHRAAARDRALALVGRIRVMRMRRTGRGRPGPALAPYPSSQPAGLAQSTAAGSAHFKAQLALYRPRASGRMRRPVAQNSTSCRIMHNVLVVFKIVDHTQIKPNTHAPLSNTMRLHSIYLYHTTAPHLPAPHPAPYPAPHSPCTTLALHHLDLHHSRPAPHCTTFSPHHTLDLILHHAIHLPSTTLSLHHTAPLHHTTLACTISALHHI